MTRFGLERANGLRGLAVAVFAASVLATLAFWAVLPGTCRVTMDTDYAGFYRPVARNIVMGNGITLRDAPATRYPPGYPVLLSAVFGLSEWIGVPEAAGVSIFTLLCVGIASTSLFLLVSRALGRRLAVAAVVLWMTYPFVLWLTKEPMSEIPFIGLLHLALYTFWGASLGKRFVRSRYVLAGALVGFAMLVRPIAMGLGFVLFMQVGCLRRDTDRAHRFLFGLLILLGNLLVVSPWELWVHSQTGRVVLLSTGGTPSVVDGLTYAVRGKGYRSGVTIPNDVRELMEALSDRLNSTDDGQRPGGPRAGDQHLSTLGDIGGMLAGQLRERPLPVLRLFGQKALRSWYAMDSAKYESWTFAMQGVYLLLVVWGGIASWRHGGNPRSYVVLIVGLALYFWLMTTLVLSILRYMVPAMGLLITLIPVGPLRGWLCLGPPASRTNDASQSPRSV